MSIKKLLVAALLAAATFVLAPCWGETGIDFAPPQAGQEGQVVDFSTPAPPAVGGEIVPISPATAGQVGPAVGGVSRPKKKIHRYYVRLEEIPGSLGVFRHRALWRELHKAGVVSRSFVEARDQQTLSLARQEIRLFEQKQAKKEERQMIVTSIVIGTLALGAIIALVALALRGGASRPAELPGAGEVLGALPNGRVVEASAWRNSAGGAGWRVVAAPAPEQPGEAAAGGARATTAEVVRARHPQPPAPQPPAPQELAELRRYLERLVESRERAGGGAEAAELAATVASQVPGDNIRRLRVTDGGPRGLEVELSTHDPRRQPRRQRPARPANGGEGGGEGS